MNSNFWLRLALPAIVFGSVSASPLPYQPPRHTQSPPLFDKLTQAELAIEGQRGTTVERARSARWQLAESRRLSAALARIGPGRKGVVDAFVVSAGLDSDPVFGREAREAARVLSRRYAAGTRTIILGGSDGRADSTLPTASPANIAAVLARVAELMGPEDVLVLYVTAHGGPFGIVYNDGNEGFGVLGPARLSALLSELGIKNRMLLISACYSGVFVGPLVTPSTAILTAASTDRTSFGCKADNDWTFFGDAVINHALRKPDGFAAAGNEAVAMIAGWEQQGNLIPSQPQSYIGNDAVRWLSALEKTLPPVTPSIGKPATDALK